MKLKYLLQASAIAAIYAVLTILLAPISYGPMQVRISEALTILPCFTPAAVPGLFVGCLVSNLLGPYGIIDVICGSAATLIAALLSYFLRKHKWLVPLPQVIVNGIVIGGMLHFAYGVPGLFVCMLWVAAGQALSCYLIGMPLIKIFEKHKGIFN